jgi:hypothetical protein
LVIVTYSLSAGTVDDEIAAPAPTTWPPSPPSRAAFSDEDAGTALVNLPVTEDDVWPVAPVLSPTWQSHGPLTWSNQYLSARWNPLVSVYDEWVANTANYYAEEEAAPLAAVQQLLWTASAASDDEVFSPVGALDEAQPSPALFSMQAVAWNGRAFTDGDEGAQFVNLPVDDESPPSAPRQSTSTYYANLSTVYADEDAGAALANLPVEEEYSPPLPFTQSWTAVAFADDEIAANLPTPIGVEDEANPLPASAPAVAYRGAFFQEDEIAAAPIVFFASDDEAPFAPQQQIVAWNSPRVLADDEIGTRLKNFRVEEEQGPIPPAMIITWVRLAAATDDDAPQIVLTAIEDEAAALTPQSATWTTAPQVFADEDPGIDLSIINVDDEATYAPQRQTIAWIPYVAAEDESGTALVNIALDEVTPFVAATMTVSWAPPTVAADDETSAPPQVISDQADLWFPPQSTRCGWDTKIIIRASSEGLTSPANFPVDDEGNQPPATMRTQWTAAVFADEGDYVANPAQLADDESAPLPQRMQITWQAAVYADEDAGLALTYFGVDDEAGWQAPSVMTVAWVTPTAAVAADELGAQLPIGEESYWIQPAAQQVAWRAAVFVDEDAGPQLAAFGLEDEYQFTAQIQQPAAGGWQALVFTTDEERFSSYWSPIDDDAAAYGQQYLISWLGWVFPDSDEGVNFFVAGVPPQKIKDIHSAVQFVTGSTGQSRVKGKYTPTQQITGRYGG